MHCLYFLVFLLALLPLSTLTTAEQYGGTELLNDQASTGRFCLRGSRSKFQNHPPQPTEKYLEKTSPYVDATEQETIEPEEISQDDEEGNPIAGKVAVKKSKEFRFEDKPSDLVKVTKEQKKDEANKYKTAAAPPSKTKGSNFNDFEDTN